MASRVPEHHAYAYVLNCISIPLYYFMRMHGRMWCALYQVWWQVLALCEEGWDGWRSGGRRECGYGWRNSWWSTKPIRISLRTCSAATNVFHPTYQPLKWFFLICSRCRQKVNPAYCEGASCCMTTSITVLPTDNFWSPRNPSVAFWGHEAGFIHLLRRNEWLPAHRQVLSVQLLLLSSYVRI